MLERFESKFDKGDGCWVWKAHKNKNGYGQFGVMLEGRNGYMVNRYAHRVSWMLYRGEIPEGLCVCHSCDNPSCVNPDHLFLGTRKDNTQDMINKGRHLEGNRMVSEKRRGIPWTPEQRKNIMKSMKRGEDHFRSIPVFIDGVSYPSMSAAGKALGLTRQAIYYRYHRGQTDGTTGSDSV